MTNPQAKEILRQVKEQIDKLPNLEAQFHMHRDLMLYHGAEATRIMGQVDRIKEFSVDARRDAYEIALADR